MNKLTEILSSIIFIALITGSIQSISTDGLDPSQGIFKDYKQVSISSTEDSKYLIHLQLIVRNAQGQLVSVSETDAGKYYVGEYPMSADYIFDELFSKKEIIIIDKIKYEKVSHIQTINVQDLASFGVRYDDMQSTWSIEYCKKGGGQEICRKVFSTFISHISLGEDDVFTTDWTILRKY